MPQATLMSVTEWYFDLFKSMTFLKTDTVNHMSLRFNVIPVAETSCQKHLDLYLDEKLNFSHHIKEIVSKVNKGIGIIEKRRNILARNALLSVKLS